MRQKVQAAQKALWRAEAQKKRAAELGCEKRCKIALGAFLCFQHYPTRHRTSRFDDRGAPHECNGPAKISNRIRGPKADLKIPESSV